MPRLREAPLRRVALVIEDQGASKEAARALAARSIPCEPAALEDSVESGVGAIAFAPGEPPDPARAAELAPLCARAARAGRPIVLLCAFPRERGRAARQTAAALATLRAHGAILCVDPDAWLEALVLLSAFGLPGGPRTAVVAPPGTWLSAAAVALAAEAATQGARFSPVSTGTSGVGPTDVVLVDVSEWEAADAPSRARPLAVPVAGRAELLGPGRVALVGLRAALAAATLCGRLAERIAAGLGPDDPGAGPDPDQGRLRRQLDRLGAVAGDHETKVLLAAYGVEVTRQAVATTPSAAATKAKQVGFPVELKPWTADAPTELDGCPVERGLATAAEVRRAFAAVGRALDGSGDAPVIVREGPPPGRELRARFERLPELGPFVLVDVLGLPEPLGAPAPLRAIDAEEIASRVAATRAGDPDPDRRALADLLRRASYLAATCDRIAWLDLARVVVGARGEKVVVADARAGLENQGSPARSRD